MAVSWSPAIGVSFMRSTFSVSTLGADIREKFAEEALACETHLNGISELQAKGENRWRLSVYRIV